MLSQGHDAWTWRMDSGMPAAADISGYAVEALDGKIGKVEETYGAPDASFIIIDTGPWIFGHRIMVPAGFVNHVDHMERRVYVECTQDDIKGAPAFDPELYADHAYRDKVASHYGGGQTGRM